MLSLGKLADSQRSYKDFKTGCQPGVEPERFFGIDLVTTTNRL